VLMLRRVLAVAVFCVGVVAAAIVAYYCAIGLWEAWTEPGHFKNRERGLMLFVTVMVWLPPFLVFGLFAVIADWIRSR
jgi:hypothetical protein